MSPNKNKHLTVYILCIETSTNVCSVCIAKDGSLLVVKKETDFKSHTEKLTILIQACLNETDLSMEDLSAICISEGPGSYTGLRIGASTAKGLCFGLDIPLISINSLLVLAQGVHKNIPHGEIILSAIDARRAEIYGMVFDHTQNMVKSTCAIVLNEDNILTQDYAGRKINVIGNGSSKVKELLTNEVEIHQSEASAAFMCRLAFEKYEGQTFNDLITFSPYYFKNPNITTSKKRFF